MGVVGEVGGGPNSLKTRPDAPIRATEQQSSTKGTQQTTNIQNSHEDVYMAIEAQVKQTWQYLQLPLGAAEGEFNSLALQLTRDQMRTMCEQVRTLNEQHHRVVGYYQQVVTRQEEQIKLLRKNGQKTPTPNATIPTTPQQCRDSSTTPISYADAAGSKTVKKQWGPLKPARELEASGPNNTVAVDTAKGRRITIHLKNEADQKSAQESTNATLLERFQEGNDKAKEGLIAAFYKREQKVAVVAAISMAARESLEKEHSWATAAFQSAQIQTRTYPVRVHGVQLAALENDEGIAISRLIRENERLHPGLRIKSVRWVRSAQKLREDGSKKKCSTLHMELYTPEDVNSLVTQGLLDSANLLACERWAPGLEVMQCLRCQSYNHKATNCKREKTCAYCAGPHDTRDHPVDFRGETKCGACGGPHVAFSQTCEVRERERKKCLQRRLTKPALYAARAAVQTATKVADGFTLVVNKTTKKRKTREISRGRSLRGIRAPSPPEQVPSPPKRQATRHRRTAPPNSGRPLKLRRW